MDDDMGEQGSTNVGDEWSELGGVADVCKHVCTCGWAYFDGHTISRGDAFYIGRHATNCIRNIRNITISPACTNQDHYFD
jgi:hypothetical protein